MNYIFTSEFAKEAMTCQALDKGEILSIRWAHDDPNPVAQDSIDRADKDALVGLLQAKGISLTPAAFEYPADYQLPDAKRPRLTDAPGAVDESVLQQYPDLAYPNTDNQYAAAAASAQQQQQAATLVEIPAGDGSTKKVDITSPEYAAYYADYCAKYYAQQSVLARYGIDLSAYGEGVEEPAEAAGASSSSSAAATGAEETAAAAPLEEEAAGGEEEPEWAPHTDEATGATYYFNSSTGESSWTDPR